MLCGGIDIGSVPLDTVLGTRAGILPAVTDRGSPLSSMVLLVRALAKLPQDVVAPRHAFAMALRKSVILFGGARPATRIAATRKIFCLLPPPLSPPRQRLVRSNATLQILLLRQGRRRMIVLRPSLPRKTPATHCLTMVLLSRVVQLTVRDARH